MLTYAVPDDLVDFDSHLDVAEVDADRFIRAASSIVRYAIRGDVYDAAPSGVPADPELAGVLRDAVCAQVAHWSRNGIDPGTVGATQPARQVKTMSEGTRSITYTDDDPGVTSTRAASATDLCFDAAVILRDAGFLSGKPWRY